MQSFTFEPPGSRQIGWRLSILRWSMSLSVMVSIFLTFSIAQVESFNAGIGISWARSNHFSPGVIRSKKTLIFQRSVRLRMKARNVVCDPFASAYLLRRQCSSQGSVTGNVIGNKMRTRNLVLFSSVVRSSHGIFEADDDSTSSTLENGTSDSKRNETAADFQSGGGSISLKEDEEFKAAVKDVKDAAKNVTSSAIGLTTTIASKGPGILVRLLFAIVSVELRDDIERRKGQYVSDWTDAFRAKRRCIPAILFLYFSCIAPVVSFGTIASQITEGSLGVLEFLVASGGAGMAYSILSGQPMSFLAPTGLSLAFLSGLYRFCSVQNTPFFPIYTWVGLWTSLFMITLGFKGSSKLIRFCTRFTDEIFNALLSLNFIYEAASSIRRNFITADPMNLSMPFVSLSMALGTYWSTTNVIALETSMYFSKKVRTMLKDFGPVVVLIAFSALNKLNCLHKFGVPTLSVPEKFSLAGGRNFLVPFLNVPTRTRLLCALPAILLTGLFFMDQNISVRVVNKEENKLKKGAAYNIDMVALGLITAVLSIFGLPWMCGATVQSMNHVRAMTTKKYCEETQQMEIEDVVETRATGFIVHALIAATITLLPKLRSLPIPVVSGVFLFLGRKLMTGNTFLKRIPQAFAESKRLPGDHPIQLLGRKKMNLFTSIQILCLGGLWAFKQNTATAIFFPSVIGMLMAIRVYVLPKIFSEEELKALGETEFI